MIAGKNMLNIVVPMAGAGSRFAMAGYKDTKPLIPIRGVPMIRLVIENLRPARSHRFIFVCQRQHLAEYALQERLTAWAPGAEVIAIDGLTEGAACTVLAAEHLIDSGDALMIANSDQWIDADIDAYLAQMDAARLDGLIMTMTADDAKWSYVALDERRHVTRVIEKVVISDEATVGIYNYARGADFVRAAKEMIAQNERSNNEFYVAPVYNYMIRDGAAIGIRNIGREAAGMYGLGIPADLELFARLDVCDEALSKVAA